jgi:hypothetical protein
MKNGCNKMGRGKGVGGDTSRGINITLFHRSCLARRLSKRQYTDKKENKIFLIYKESQMGSGAKSYAPDPSEFPKIYEENFLFFFIGVVIGLLVLKQLAQGRNKKPR